MEGKQSDKSKSRPNPSQARNGRPPANTPSRPLIRRCRTSYRLDRRSSSTSSPVSFRTERTRLEQEPRGTSRAIKPVIEMGSNPAVGPKLDELPEDVLCSILSWLPMRDAARASASCSTFLRIWGRHPRLTFDEDTLRLRKPLTRHEDDGILLQQHEEHARGFVLLVDGILASRRRGGDRAAALESLVVRFAHLRTRHAPCVDRWVRSALASATTRHLVLDLAPHGSYNPERLWYDFPCSLLAAGTPAAAALEHLCLRQVVLVGHQPAPAPAPANLATLVLDKVRVTNEDLERFLSACPKLQSLELKRCPDLVYVKVSPASPRRELKQLRFLAVEHCWSVGCIDVSGSAIESLRVAGQNLPASLLLGSAAAPAGEVTSATFDLDYIPTNSAGTDHDRPPSLELLRLAHIMPRLESLFLTLGWEMKAVIPSRSSNNNYRFRHLKRVNITMYMPGQHGRDDFLFLHSFLDAAPVLESLSLHVMRWAPALQATSTAHPETTFRKHPRAPHHSLRDVDIVGFDGDLASLELALYILDNARALRRLSLEQTWSDEEEDDDGGVSARLMLLVHKAIARHIAPAVPQDSGILLRIK
ncbi:hypothetical protein ACP70R_025802 [Stipagrostis hirtigluma subsp. patula]